MIKVNHFFFVIVIFFFSCSETKIYTLTPEKIKDSEIIENYDKTYSIILLLNDNEKKEFENLTAENIGEVLIVRWNDQNIITEKISSKIESGIIQFGEWNTYKEAENFLSGILNNDYMDK